MSRRLLGPARVGSQWWSALSAAAELRAWASARSVGGLIHVMYGEDLLGLAPRLPGNTPVVATFHQPFERAMSLGVRRATVARLAAAIVLDDANHAAWQAAFPSLRVHSLRLGIDTDFWTPGAEPRKRACLVVGGHLRDLDLLERALPRLLDADVEIDLVGLPAEVGARWRARWPRVRAHRGISDEALRGLYRRAGAFLLPLSSASGNNALLQAMACGTPVVGTDMGAVRSYVGDDGAAWCAPGALDAHVAATLEVLKGGEAVEARAAAALERVDAYSVRASVARHRAVYAAL